MNHHLYKKSKQYKKYLKKILIFLFSTSQLVFSMHSDSSSLREGIDEAYEISSYASTLILRAAREKINEREEVKVSQNQIVGIPAISDAHIAHQPFTYLSEMNNPHVPEHLRDKVADLSTMYNTYPFDLPYDHIIKTTFCFRNKYGSRPSDLTSKLLQNLEHSGHIIVEGNLDLNPLKSLRGSFYNIHFWGEDALESLKSFNAVLRYWVRKTSLYSSISKIDSDIAILKGIDISIPKVIDQKEELIKLLLSILKKSHQLETLSVRFAGLTTDDCQTIFQTLKKHNKQLRRIILSFNELSSEVISEEGYITSAFNDYLHFPHLRYIDIRGHHFESANFTPLKEAIENRIENLRGILHENLVNLPFLKCGSSFLKFESLERYEGNFDLSEPSLLDAASKFKRIFHHQESETVLHNDYFICYHEGQQLPYADLADQLLLIRYGHMPINRIDFHGLHLQHSSFRMAYQYGFILPWIISLHIQDRTHLVYFKISQHDDNNLLHPLIISFLRTTMIPEDYFQLCFT